MLLHRTIPARAGSTTHAQPESGQPTDHPRSRGEHIPRKEWWPADTGPSPLARGAPGRSPPGTSPGSDHPRSRGEHMPVPATSCHGSGPSPLARGARTSAPQTSATEGTIPARAGSTTMHRRQLRRPPDHPRTRGEHLNLPAHIASNMGPSPLARGAHVRDRSKRALVGTIPARAGSTHRGLSGVGSHADHPRSRGEHTGRKCRMKAATGPSPLARGAHPYRAPTARGRGTIPARAGSTDCSPSSTGCCSDHPRSRGEHIYVVEVKP